MFQIVCALALDVPAVAGCVTDFHGISPDVLLSSDPWGHVDHAGVACGCHSLTGRELMFTWLLMMGRVLTLVRPLSVIQCLFGI